MDLGNIGAAGFDSTTLNDRIGAGAVNREQNMINNLLNRTSFADMLEKEHDTPQSISSSVTIDKTDKLYEQCLELEVFLVKTLISSMRNTVQKSGLIDEGFAGKMYEDMLYDEYARDLTKNANFGMAEMAYLELSGQRGKTIVR